ncbi:E3 ubiquitin-protein ligase XB3 [Iris pallida]|uniref:RING-type E3 ubiquitin transferase n=1 Tax=Iris pallida TaxID=29817 RepID=A0AAX6FNA1_IRIPA|nr:E3 ubiquitin-protein ligase XB3 [Iris pallida]
MGQGLRCVGPSREVDFFRVAQSGDVDVVGFALRWDPTVLDRTTVYDRLSALHIAAANGRLEVLSMLLDRVVHPDLLNRHRQTPLMLATMHGKIACVQKLLQAGSNILMFDSLHERTCLHYAAYCGHSDCLQAILSAATSTYIADSWGFILFVNVRKGNGATLLHLIARQRRPQCVRILLDNGALVCASTGGYDCPGSTPLHLATRGGCLDRVRELITWGADRLQQDSSGRIPFVVAHKRKHGACAALLNPSSAEPLVWHSPLKFISELNPEAKALLEMALMDTNREREKKILKGTTYSMPLPEYSDDGIDDDMSEDDDSNLYCICFDQACTIEVQACGHQMYAHCTMALCCHNKPNPVTLFLATPICLFCRSNIA